MYLKQENLTEIRMTGLKKKKKRQKNRKHKVCRLLKIMKNILNSKYLLITTDVHHIYKNVIIVVRISHCVH